ncbi:NAD-dependent epimerase/dehydratase family protein [Clostridium perfringens]|nr:NAD-dependent epimerase/dehydratase family protein [Clostridium perfringens]
MKNILITGANSYVGTSFENYLKKWPNDYNIDTVDMRCGTWKNKDFSKYDVVFHVAGIAHVSTDPKMKDLYYKVNRDLTIETAKKAKRDGVKQFIFMSSIIVYGDSSNNKSIIIDENTVPIPSNFYGKSKLQAEEGIFPLQDNKFNVVVIRPPMIFGKGSKGNYPKLSKIAQKLPIFPDIKNERSMLYIDNLCEFIRLMVINEEKGLFFPQNDKYIGTSELVKLIAKCHGKKIIFTKVFNPALKLIGNFTGIVDKAFGNLIYDKRVSEYKVEYRIKNLEQAICETELGI